MLTIKGKKKIDLSKGGDIYIIKKGSQQIILQEDESGEVEFPVDDIFKNARSWKWGIRTDKYWGVFLRAISFKIPKLFLTVENIIISIRVKKEDEVSLMALVFNEDKDKAFKEANRFRRENRDFVAFELVPNYEEYVLRLSRLDVVNLLSNITSTLEEIKEDTKQVKQNTSEINFQTKLILKEVEKIAESVELIRQKVDNIEPIVKSLEEKVFNQPSNPQTKQEGNAIIVHRIKEDGVYDETGDKIYVKIIGNIFDYLDIDIPDIKKTFGIKELTEEQEEKLRKLVKEKYFRKEKFITPKDMEDIGLTPALNKSWRISLKIKDVEVKRAGAFLQKHLNIKKVEEKIMKAIKNVVPQKRELTIEDLEEFLDENEKQVIHKVKKIIQGKYKDIKGNIYVKADEEVEDIVLKALIIQAKKENKEVIIK